MSDVMHSQIWTPQHARHVAPLLSIANGRDAIAAIKDQLDFPRCSRQLGPMVGLPMLQNQISVDLINTLRNRSALLLFSLVTKATGNGVRAGLTRT